MPVRVFSEQEKENLRICMLESGMQLLKEYGMTHMSIARIAKEAGIGKSTFYNFFESKEAFVNEMLKYQRNKMMEYLKSTMAGKEKLTVTESKEAVRHMVFEAEHLYRYLTPEEERALYEQAGVEKALSLSKEIQRMDAICSMMDGVQEKPDYPVIANIMKILAITAENRYLLHEEGYQRTQDRLLDILYSLLFEEGEK